MINDMETVDNVLLERALQIATRAHAGQTDKAGAAYVFHPIRVACRCLTTEEKVVALLHDVIEDTDVTPEYLLAEGFPQTIVDSILSVTRKEQESYEEFIKRCQLDKLGRIVKLHDLEDNMDISRLPSLHEKDLLRLNKYIRAYRYLTGQMEPNLGFEKDNCNEIERENLASN